VTADHEYTHFGVYTTTVSVSGGPLGHTGSSTGLINVADLPIRSEGTTIQAVTGAAFVGQLAEFKDENELSQAPDFTASIDWGDGTPITSGVIGGKDGNFDVTGNHTYTSPGTFAYRVTFQHPGAAPAVAVGTANVQQGAGGGGGGGGPTTLTAALSSPRSSISRSRLHSVGLPLNLTVPAAAPRSLRMAVRNSAGRTVTRATLRIPRGTNVKTRWKPSAATIRKLTGTRYILRIQLPDGAILQTNLQVTGRR
jgi:hypothetical protein